MMRAKQEESKRSLAEAAVANAKAAKRQTAAASEVDNKGDNVSVGQSPTRRKKQVKSGGAGSGISVTTAAEVDLPDLLEGPTGGPGSHSHDNGFSPTKSLRSISNSPGSVPCGMSLSSPRPHRDSPTAPVSPEKIEENVKKILEVVSPPENKEPTKEPVGGKVYRDRTITIDFEAAAATVALVPDLPSLSSVSTFCGADWLAAFARLDLDEVNNDRETGNVPLRRPSTILRPASPTIDAKSTFHAVSAGGAGPQ
jgi:hypothetical protein